MWKKVLVTAVGLVALLAFIAGAKAMQIMTLIDLGASMVMPPTVVGASEVKEQEWEQTLNAVGSLEAMRGVVVTADNPGRVTDIHFVAGAQVKAGDILISQDTSNESAQLRSAQASAALAKSDLDRNKELLAKGAASKSQYDSAEATYKQAVAQVDDIRSTILKKSVRAPFDGRLGIRQINLGQDLGTGDPIVSLQAVDPMFVNFFLPQQDLSKLDIGLEVRVTSNAVPDESFIGKITAINPEIDPSTRNVRVQATLENSKEKLLPGMFTNVKVVLPASEKVLAVPVTAVAYATYGDSVYVVTESVDEKTGKKQLVAQQHFVRLGRALGDFVAVEKGIDPGVKVVSTGVFKLRNGAPIAINNESTPEFKTAPQPEDS